MHGMDFLTTTCVRAEGVTSDSLSKDALDHDVCRNIDGRRLKVDTLRLVTARGKRGNAKGGLVLAIDGTAAVVDLGDANIGVGPTNDLGIVARLGDGVAECFLADRGLEGLASERGNVP